MEKGWFIGNFDPSIKKTTDVEVAIKTYKKGDYEKEHYHKAATEITAVISGIIEMQGVQYREGDIIEIPPFQSTDFRALSAVTTVVVKHPGAENDKFLGKSK